jgi:hypothetical protein
MTTKQLEQRRMLRVTWRCLHCLATASSDVPRPSALKEIKGPHHHSEAMPIVRVAPFIGHYSQHGIRQYIEVDPDPTIPE